MGLRKRVTIIADSNFLMLIAEGEVTPSMIDEAIDLSYRLVVPKPVLDELSRIASSAPQLKVRRLALRAKHLVEAGVLHAEIANVHPLEGEKVDDYLVRLASTLREKGEEIIVATSDRELRRRLRRMGIPSLFYREEGRRLVAEWINP